MEKDNKAYDDVNAMAPYAMMLGKTNTKRLSRLQRIDLWWDTHPTVRRTLASVAVLVMVGFALYHMYTF